MPLLQISNPIQRYHWGSTTAIATLLGRSVPSREPEAEMWMGTHPKAPSLVEGKSVSLLDLVRRDPDTTLGTRAPTLMPPGETEAGLPFLLKILAADKALSIQAHPDLELAAEGWQRDEARDVALDAPNRNYRDRNHKPELICALSDFYGMAGFRPYAELTEELTKLLETVGGDVPDSIREQSMRFIEAPGAGTLSEWFDAVVSLLLPEHSKSAERFVGALLEYASSQADGEVPDRDDRYWWVHELSRQYPGDPGIGAPLYLNIVHLKRGQAAYLGPRYLHAYLHGVGIEIMANSDNVLRAGCTTKHVDPAELRRILLLEESEPIPINPDDGAVTVYRTPAREFELTRVDATRASEFQIELTDTPAILLSVGAEFKVAGGFRIRSGESLFATADTTNVAISLSIPSETDRLSGKTQSGNDAFPDRALTEIPQLFVAALPGGVRVTLPQSGTS